MFMIHSSRMSRRCVPLLSLWMELTEHQQDHNACFLDCALCDLSQEQLALLAVMFLVSSLQAALCSYTHARHTLPKLLH